MERSGGKIIVQKFGGTSVATPATRELVIHHILRAREDGYRPVVVVSAMGREGDPYATDTLLRLFREAGGFASGREQDLLLACGEVISAVILTQNLKAKGYPAVALTGMQAGLITDDRFGNASVIAVQPDRVLEALDEGKIAVVAGFQGATPRGEVTTLGRGGSDTSAALLGAALKAELVEIYTDVDGIKTADPRIVPEAVTLERVTYAEAIEMAHLGARVVHPRAVEVAMAAEIPLKVRETGSEAPGTLISSTNAPGPQAVTYSERPVTGIAHVADRAYVQVRAAGESDRVAHFGIFEMLGNAGVNVDMIRLSPDRVSFIVAGNQKEETERILDSLEVDSTVQAGYAKVSAVGAGMYGVPGVMARFLRAFWEAGITIYETTDSHANISALVRAEEMHRAVAALHDEFRLRRAQASVEQAS